MGILRSARFTKSYLKKIIFNANLYKKLKTSLSYTKICFKQAIQLRGPENPPGGLPYGTDGDARRKF